MYLSRVLYLRLVLMAVFWSGVFPAVNILLRSMDLFTAVFLRFWWAAVILKERLGPARALGFALSVAGALWVLCRGDPRAFFSLELGAGELMLILGEPFTPALLAGAALVGAGLYLTNKPR